MRSRALLASIGLLVVALTAIADPSDAAKKKKPRPPVRVPLAVSTATGSASVSLPSTLPRVAEVSAIATCPSGTVAIGGGFAGSVNSEQSQSHVPLISESVRVGATQWRTRGIALFGANATAQDLTTEVYCMPSKGTIADVATQTSIGANTTDTAGFTVACPASSQLLSGGFSGLASTGPPPNLVAATESAPAGNSWSIQMGRLGDGSSAEVTGHAYCYTPPPAVKKKKKRKKSRQATVARKKKKRKQTFITGPSPLTVLSGSGILPTPLFSTASVGTAPCAAPLVPISGGFSVPGFASTSGAAVVESRVAAGAWRVTATQIGFPAPSELPITAYNGCA
jgi:hypothetical protein